jgi:hypothetical protein
MNKIKIIGIFINYRIIFNIKMFRIFNQVLYSITAFVKNFYYLGKVSYFSFLIFIPVKVIIYPPIHLTHLKIFLVFQLILMLLNFIFFSIMPLSFFYLLLIFFSFICLLLFEPSKNLVILLLLKYFIFELIKNQLVHYRVNLLYEILCKGVNIGLIS